MMETVSALFEFEHFLPHGHCFHWIPSLLWTLVISDGVIAISYYSIPLALLVLVRRRSSSLNWIVLMFSAFIFACGTTHLIDIATVWYPNYWLDAGAKSVTAAISAATAIVLWPLVRRATSYVDIQERTAEELAGTNLQLRETLNVLEKQHDDLQRLNNLSGLLHICNSFQEIATTTADAVAHIFPDSTGALYLIDAQEREFSLRSSWGNATYPQTIAADACWAFRLGRIFPDTRIETGLTCDAGGCGLKSRKFCLPVSGGGKILGVLQFENLDVVSNERIRPILSVLVERLGLALYDLHLKQSLEFSSTRDALTGLFNRRYLDEALGVEQNRARRTGDGFSLIMFDLDHFKELNDTHGHETGDRALKLFSEILQSKLRAGDIACRYGGEEFVLVLPGAESRNAEESANRIRMSLEARARDSSDNLKTLTVSAGVASFPDNGSDSLEVLRAADQALLEAKNAGRNTVIRA